MDGLKQGIVDKIKIDAILYGKVADALKINPLSLNYLLKRNNVKLRQYDVLKVLREHLGITEDNELLMEDAERAVA